MGYRFVFEGEAMGLVFRGLKVCGVVYLCGRVAWCR